MSIHAVDGVRAASKVFIFEPELLDAVAEVMGAERLILNDG